MRAAIALAASALMGAGPAAGQSFPLDASWVPVSPHGCIGPITDAALDSSTGLGTGSRDLVSADEATVQAFADSGFLYFRLRVDTDPRNVSDWDNFGWGCQISSNGSDSSFEWMVLLNGATPSVEVHRNTVATVPETPADASESLTVSYAATDSNARDASDGSSDFFVDFAVPLSDLSLTAASAIQVVCGANSNHATTLSTGAAGDIAGVGSTGNPIWNTVSSCPFQTGCNTFGCPFGQICFGDGVCGECAVDEDCVNPELPVCDASTRQCTAIDAMFASSFETFTLAIDNFLERCSLLEGGVPSSPSKAFDEGTVVALHGEAASVSFVWGYWIGTDAGGVDPSQDATVTMSSDRSVLACCPFAFEPNAVCN